MKSWDGGQETYSATIAKTVYFVQKITQGLEFVSSYRYFTRQKINLKNTYKK